MFKWSWRVGTVAEIGIFIHWTFALILAWVAITYALAGAPLAAVAEALALILAIFGCVILHELGHALTAKRFGIRTRDITLLPIGGVARLERMPERPIHELLVALAGPAVNVVIAIVLAALLVVWRGGDALVDMAFIEHSLLAKLFYLNIILAVFNLLPAFPMDGGRVLRALLAMRLSYERATDIAASVGQAMAISFAAIGIFYNWFLIFIALFVYIGAQQEAEQIRNRSLLAGARVGDAMITNFTAMRPHDPIVLAADRLLHGDQQHFPVVDARGRVAGVLTRPDLIQALAGTSPSQSRGRGHASRLAAGPAKRSPHTDRRTYARAIVSGASSPARRPSGRHADPGKRRRVAYGALGLAPRESGRYDWHVPIIVFSPRRLSRAICGIGSQRSFPRIRGGACNEDQRNNETFPQDRERG